TSPSTPTPQASSSMLRPRPSTTLFPYTTLFRSNILHKEMPAYNPYMMRHEIQTKRSLSRLALTLGAVSLAAILIMSYPLFQQERSEEHTSELQSRENLVCRLLLEKKKNTPPTIV